MRSIALDGKHCAKLMEEGTSTQTSPVTADKQTTVERIGDDPQADGALTSSSRAAWQKVLWKDVAGLWVNFDTTEIDWTYNGSTVLSGSVYGWTGWRSGTGWGQLYSYKSGSLGSGGSYYLGNTWSGFSNDKFCLVLPTVYTYYYYNKMWGQRDGTATRAQSSDSINECLPFHVDIESAYGHYPG